MAKNSEAKIKFTAETGGFNDAIKKSSDELSKLRAELKLNDAEMKTNGASVEGLEKKHAILTEELKLAGDKTEALSAKLDKAVEIYGEGSAEVTKLHRQIAQAKVEEEHLKQAISKCNTELQQHTNAADEAKSATAQLTDKIEQQQTELNDLKDEYVEAVLQYGKNSKEAKDLAKEIGKLSGELKENKTTMNEASDKADKLDKSLDDAGNSASNSADGFTIAALALADLASNAIQAAIGKVSEFVGWLKELPEATRELRQDMATLETSYARAGFTVDQAKTIWQDLYRVFGEDDRAVEAANLIAKMSSNQEDLNTWVTITQGIWGTYQDSLPVEGLAEASMETAKVGQVTGVLADALNWSSEAATMFAKYMSEDVTNAEDAFNEALKECTTEQERQALINETLTALYGEAAAEYEKASGAQLDAKDATAENTVAQMELAKVVEPTTTAYTNLKTELITAVIPAVTKLSEWGTSALGWMREHPKATTLIATTLGILSLAFTGLAIAAAIYTLSQIPATAALWAFLAPLLPIVAAVTAVIVAIAALIIYWDEIKNAVIVAAQAVWNALKTAWEWIVNLFSTVGTWIYDNVIAPVAQFFTDLWNGIVTAFTTAWNSIISFFTTIGTWIYDNVISPVAKWFTDLWNGIVYWFHVIIDPWIEIVRRISVIIYDSVIKPIADFFVNLWNDITSGLQAAWDWCVGIALTVAGWVNTNVIQPIANFFVSLWTGIKNGVNTAINTVKNVFATVSGWVNQKVIQPVTNFFSKLWNGFTNGAKNAWNGVKSVFNAVGGFFGKVFGIVKDKIVSVFQAGGKVFNNIKDGIVNVFKTVVNGIIKGINKVISLPFKGLNTILDKIHGITIVGVQPFSWLTWRAPVPQIPLLAKGGIVDRPTLNIAGEAGAEAIIPIDKLQTYIMGAVEKTMQTVNLHALAAAVEDLANRPIELNINGRQFALATAGDTDSVNGLRNVFKSRGLAVE